MDTLRKITIAFCVTLALVAGCSDDDDHAQPTMTDIPVQQKPVVKPPAPKRPKPPAPKPPPHKPWPWPDKDDKD